MTPYEFHPAANIFPMMTGDDFRALVEDIRQNGQREAITLHQGQILDGRNRYSACLELGIEPKFTEWDGDDALKFVLSLNLHRRHLNETQRAIIAGKIANMPNHRPVDKCANLHTYVSVPEAAKMLNVSERTVKSVRAIERAAPELIPQMEAGTMRAAEAEKIIKTADRRADIVQQREAIAQIDPETCDLFDVVVIDPPWPYGTEYDPSGRRAANPYPEMSLESIEAIDVPAADDCILWLWTTHKFMRYSFELLEAWGFRDVAILTWVKDRMGLGSWLRSQSEFCIMAIKGKPTINLTNETTVIHGPLREHSRKPDEFYEMVDGLCVGTKIDYFSRQRREGWAQHGNRLEQFASSKEG